MANGEESVNNCVDEVSTYIDKLRTEFSKKLIAQIRRMEWYFAPNETPEDAAQEVFSRLLKHWRNGDFERPTQPWAYLKTVARNRVSRPPANHRLQCVPLSDAGMAAQGTPADTTAAAQEIRTYLGTLPREQYTAIILVDVYGLTYRELADKIGLTYRGQAHRVHKKAIENLRRLLEQSPRGAGGRRRRITTGGQR